MSASATATNHQLLDGKLQSNIILDSLKIDVQRMSSPPRLAVIVAAQDAPSLSYVKMKQKWAAKIGAESEAFFVTPEVTQAKLMGHVHSLNENPDINGILVQHPLPSHIDEAQVLSTVRLTKDVDGISPLSIGRLASRLNGHRAATPLGIIRLLDAYNIPLRGANVVVVGCSIILGRPMALMFIERDATVTITHKYTKNLPELLSTADIVVSATGVPELIKGHQLKEGSVAIDCGYSLINGKAVGDIEFEEACKRVSYITPVPGGVGPMTVATLLSNLVDAYWEQNP